MSSCQHAWISKLPVDRRAPNTEIHSIIYTNCYSLKPEMSTSRVQLNSTTDSKRLIIKYIHTHTSLWGKSKHSSLFCMPCRACPNWSQEVVRPRLVGGWKELGGFEGYLVIRILLDLELQSIYDGEDKGKGIHPDRDGWWASVEEWGAGGTLACGLQVVGAIGELTSRGPARPPHAARLPAAGLRTTPPPRHQGTTVLEFRV